MSPDEFRAIRMRLQLTQTALGERLGYTNNQSISTFERSSNPRPVPKLLAMVMEALDAGWRPKEWPDDTAADAGTGGEGTRDQRDDAKGHAAVRRAPVRQHRPRQEA